MFKALQNGVLYEGCLFVPVTLIKNINKVVKHRTTFKPVVELQKVFSFQTCLTSLYKNTLYNTTVTYKLNRHYNIHSKVSLRGLQSKTVRSLNILLINIFLRNKIREICNQL